MGSSDVLVARQAVFDVELNVEAYELFARSSTEAEDFAGLHPSTATSKVISDAFLHMDVRSVTDGLPAYINFTEELLLDESAGALPSEFTIIDLLAEVNPTSDVIARCRELRRCGYRLALDDLGPSDPRMVMLDEVDTVKIDFLSTSPSDRRELVTAARTAGCCIVATKIESPDAFDEARRLGCDAFQGYHFQRPVLVKGKRIVGARLSYLQLLEAVSAERIDYDHVEGLIKRDISLAWMLLNYLNASCFGWRDRVDSVQLGLRLLGDDGVRRWVSLMAVTAIGEDVPAELLSSAVVRARFCESVAASTVHVNSLDAFLVGMFSLLDEMVGEPLQEILRQVSVPKSVERALIDEEGDLGDVLNLVVAYERGGWLTVRDRAARLALEISDLTPLYLEALAWAREAIPVVRRGAT